MKEVRNYLIIAGTFTVLFFAALAAGLEGVSR